MNVPANINKLNDFKKEVWRVIFRGLKEDSLKTHEKAVTKEINIKKTNH